jgi:hypothetical protein
MKVQMRAMLQAIDCHLPPQNDTFKTNYFLNKMLAPWELSYTCQEYCGECFSEWKETETVCQTCADNGTETFRYLGNKEDQKCKRMKCYYFITFNVIEQLQQQLKRKYLMFHAHYNFS